MYDDINATKRVTLGRLSMLGAAIALRGPVSAPVAGYLMRRSVLLPTAVASSAAVTSQSSEALPIPLIWGIGLIGISVR